MKPSKSARQYLAKIGAKGGKAKTKAKAKSSAENGKKGGRPKREAAKREKKIKRSK